ncbi:MAG TPA: AAA family ATPase, partial [Ilumatobacteraceae bacterium]|nr:AAA family ATPase [Ilumatobacteraceae bacterium]
MSAPNSSTATIMCADAVLSEHIHRVADVVRASGARVVATGADSTVVAFESASAAVTASVQLQQTLGGWMPALPIRIGLCTGDVEWTDDVCSGPALRIAAELFARARPGQILANNVVRWLAGNAAFTHVGFTEPDGDDASVEMFTIEMFAVDWEPLGIANTEHVLSGHRTLPLPAALCAAPRQRLVGRESELAELAEAWKRSEAGALEVLLIGGEAGAGKTRLAAEFARHCHDDGASVLLGT